jgi:hypothetical protein
LGFDTSPGAANPVIDPLTHITDDLGNSYGLAAPVPEPTTIALLAAGLFGFGVSRRQSMR